jgi:hypothetical protein
MCVNNEATELPDSRICMICNSFYMELDLSSSDRPLQMWNKASPAILTDARHMVEAETNVHAILYMVIDIVSCGCRRAFAYYP